VIRILVSVIIIAISLGAIVAVFGFKQSTRIHRKRAEIARKEIGFLEDCAKTSGNWPKHHLYFVFMFSMISISGLLLLFLALLEFKCAGV